MVTVPPNQLFSAFAFLGFVLAGIPLRWHLERWNAGTCMYMIWTSLACFVQFVNSVGWNGTTADFAPIWCDISSRFVIATSVAIPACSLCIARRLYLLTTSNTLARRWADRRRELYIDLAIGVGLPLLVTALAFIVQSCRYIIYENIGCWPSTANTLPAYFLVYMWPLAIGLISATYAVLTFRIALYRKSTLLNILAESQPHVTASRYWRLMLLSAIEIGFTVPLSIVPLVANTRLGIELWPGLAVLHEDFGDIPQVSAALWQGTPLPAFGLESTRWASVFCAFVFFACFGLSSEARGSYRRAYEDVMRPRTGVRSWSCGTTGGFWQDRKDIPDDEEISSWVESARSRSVSPPADSVIDIASPVIDTCPPTPRSPDNDEPSSPHSEHATAGFRRSHANSVRQSIQSIAPRLPRLTFSGHPKLRVESIITPKRAYTKRSPRSTRSVRSTRSTSPFFSVPVHDHEPIPPVPAFDSRTLSMLPPRTPLPPYCV